MIALFPILMVLAILALFWLQNQEIVYLVFFGSYKTLSLPIATWIILFTFAGLVTGLSLQVLSNFPQKTRGKNRYSSISTTESPQANNKIKSKKILNKNQDFQDENEEDDWHIEEPPSEPTLTKENEASDNFVVESSPKNGQQSGSVYSYSYLSSNNQKKKSETIYDVNYRVIKPPYQDKSAESEEESEDDEWI